MRCIFVVLKFTKLYTVHKTWCRYAIDAFQHCIVLYHALIVQTTGSMELFYCVYSVLVTSWLFLWIECIFWYCVCG